MIIYASINKHVQKSDEGSPEEEKDLPEEEKDLPEEAFKVQTGHELS